MKQAQAQALINGTEFNAGESFNAAFGKGVKQGAVAAGTTLLSVVIGSLSVCIVGLCLTGLSYGSCPTVTSAFTASFYGQKYFSVNYSIVNFNLILASFIATFSNSLLISSGSYTAPFVMLLILAVAALGLNFTIRKP